MKRVLVVVILICLSVIIHDLMNTHTFHCVFIPGGGVCYFWGQ